MPLCMFNFFGSAIMRVIMRVWTVWMEAHFSPGENQNGVAAISFFLSIPFLSLFSQFRVR